MQPQNTRYCKITVSLPCGLVEYADQEAARTSQSRSEVIGRRAGSDEEGAQR